MQQHAIGTPVYVLLALGAVAAAAAPLAAQEPPPPPPPVTIQPPPAQDPLTEPDLVMKPEQPARRIDPQRRRDQIVAMEGLLTSAVRSAATTVARQMQAFEPGLPLFTGPAQARGFYLEDYGVFFHIEIPGVTPSLAWLLDNMARDPGFADRDRDRGIAQPSRAAGRTAGVPFDQDAAYVMAVQRMLVDVMLDYRIDLQPAEWLTVAARNGDGPMSPGQIVDSPTMVLRLRAADLADFFAGRITREEIRGKVEVREF